MMLFLGIFGSLIALMFLSISFALWRGREEQKEYNPNFRQHLVTYLVVGLIGIGIALYGFCADAPAIFDDDKSKGDGITTCQNCGRKVVADVKTGYCSKCYESFVDWLEDYYD